MSSHRILSSLSSTAVFFAAYAGLSIERISSETGVAPSLLMNPDTYLPLEFFEKFFALLANAFPGRNVALELARLAPLSYLGSPGRLILRSHDARTMLNMFVDHIDLIADCIEIEMIDRGAETVLRTYWPLSGVDGGMSSEISLGLGARIARECFGKGLLRRVQFRHRARGPLAEYEELFQVPVAFQAGFNGMVFDRAALERTNGKGTPELRNVLEQRLKHLRQELGLESADGIAEIRRTVLRNALKGDYSVSGLARSMGMSISSLQRALRSADISAGRLIDETRHVNAMGLLADSRLSMDEVAFRLGFESERGFRKAFKRWSEQSPAKMRKELSRDRS